MFVKAITLYFVGMPLKFSFVTAQTTIDYRNTIIICAEDDQGNCGYGEVVSFDTPFYTKETNKISWNVLKKYLIPAVLGKTFNNEHALHEIITMFNTAHRDTPMAVAGLENALLHVMAARNQYNTVEYCMKQPLQNTIPMGVVAGDMPLSQLLSFVEYHVSHYCTRIKIKITPYDGYEKVCAVRKRFPDIDLAVDANRSYAPQDIDKIAQFNTLNLMCIEEPFKVHSINDYVELKRNYHWRVTTPLCFDETILTLSDLIEGAQHNIIDVMNIKVGRLGGLYQTKQIIQFCRDHNIRYWIGSMLESSISKLLHVQLAALGDSYMAGDLSDSKRYFYADLTHPAIEFIKGRMKVPCGVGLGAVVDIEELNKLSQYTEVFHSN